MLASRAAVPGSGWTGGSACRKLGSRAGSRKIAVAQHLTVQATRPPHPQAWRVGQKKADGRPSASYFDAGDCRSACSAQVDGHEDACVAALDQQCNRLAGLGDQALQVVDIL